MNVIEDPATHFLMASKGSWSHFVSWVLTPELFLLLRKDAESIGLYFLQVLRIICNISSLLIVMSLLTKKNFVCGQDFMQVRLLSLIHI